MELIEAVKSGGLEAVVRAIAKGIDPNIIGPDGLTALDHAEKLAEGPSSRNVMAFVRDMLAAANKEE
ncbi:MAG: hypothetical protein A3B89_03375 [Candidatus Buchananbacteria bacterium RIFCSPHIGHO2_02_FULL_40_13]|uniref:Ankyrin repeat domain-containing protein n=1 Tax=Candidatus Buchananbacteria bacterium RIFCSPLOWO2_01_FULL_39_33 TaxID=1797543 RepID=A0A1G1YIY2_9BACT|nr:MAG: hypothetical protein A3B89_03375 [Candidatus Buchananbacteria bacterium RIFCSPHIGHO2_02_FULL_40_13]OGY51786.1 MAG: hypothetical protein A3A02_04120 [Candidatus Buchananbacteria bacterium RIFCSPLOWO2_01_FULL_39_33]